LQKFTGTLGGREMKKQIGEDLQRERKKEVKK